MKIYKHYINALNVTFDPHIIYQNMIKHFPNVKFYNPLDTTFIGKPDSFNTDPLDGIMIEKYFSGKTVVTENDINYEIKLDVNIELFSERIILKELILEVKDKKTFDDIIDDKFFFNKTFSWDVKGDTRESSIWGLINDFYMKQLMPMTTNDELIQLFRNIDPTDKKSGVKYQKELKRIIGMNPDLCGATGGLNNYQIIHDNIIILDKEKEFKIDDSWTKISKNNEIYESDLLYVVNEEKDHADFVKDYKKYLLYEGIVSSYKPSLEMWFFTINKEAQELIVNLDNINEVYWKNSRLKIEEWQLHFLTQNTQRNRSISKIKKLKDYISIDKKTKSQWLNKIKECEKELDHYVGEIKYNLENLATPGHTHDEQTLQSETEKTNERILLLSFLAMSIPMLGAIFSPAFTINTKIISALILFSLPIIYFSVFRLSARRKKNLDNKREFRRKRTTIISMIEYHKNNKEEIQNNKNLDQDMKDNIIKWENENINIGERMLGKIDQKL